VKIEVSKNELIALIRGLSGGGIDECVALEKAGWMVFDGNGWNESWAWNTRKLEKLTEQELYEFYLKHKKLNDALNAKYAKYL
jgi:phage pi2 protein 07